MSSNFCPLCRQTNVLQESKGFPEIDFFCILPDVAGSSLKLLAYCEL